MGHPLFWVLLIGGLWALPLFRSLNATLPEPLSGYDSTPLSLQAIPTEGGELDLSKLSGHLLILSDLPLANAVTTETSFGELRELHMKLRAMAPLLRYLVYCHGGSKEDLRALLDRKTARKPSHDFLLDHDRAHWEEVRQQAMSPSAHYLLLDRHGRLRGIYGGEASEVDRLTLEVGQLGNWIGQDPPLGEPLHRS